MVEWNFDSFGRAIARLEEASARYADAPDEFMRDSVTQRFEIVYELGHKTLRRYLASVAADPEAVVALTFPALIRLGDAKGLLREGWPAWRRFREVRAKSSHTYDEAVALEVLEAVPDLLAEVRVLRDEIARRRE